MTIRFGAAVAVCVCVLPVAAMAAPAGMLNKTVSMSIEVSIPAKTASGQTLVARRQMKKLWYVSSAGRVFSRTDNQSGRVSSTREVAPGTKDGAPRIEGNTIVGTMGFISGAARVVVSFDSSFSSCTASMVMGREAGRAITWKGIDGNTYTATGPASASAPSCSVQAGNAFAGR